MKSGDFLESVSRKDLNLSILEPDPDQTGGVLTLPQAGSPGAHYRVTLVPCIEPRCSCCNILFSCENVLAEPATPLAPPLEFWFDPKENQIELSDELRADAESLRLAEEVRAALTAGDRERLFQWFRNSKIEIIYKTPASQADLRGLPDAAGGLMVPFLDVFHWGLDLYFQLGEEIWGVDDQFCVRQECDCQATVIAFLNVGKVSGEKTTRIEKSPAVHYNYGSGESREASPGKSGNPPTALLLSELKKACPDLNRHLRHRHLLLQNLYLCARLAELTELAARAAAPVSPMKVGRNDPCPCGSGKKFKRCCLGAK